MKFHKLYIAAIGAASMAMAGCELDIVNSDQLNILLIETDGVTVHRRIKFGISP